MARKFETSAIIDPVNAPVTGRSLEHINSAYDELGAQIIKSQFAESYTTNDVVILYGCVVTANIPGTSSVTAGAIFYNDRIYYVDANVSISSPSNTLVWSIATTYIAGDPAIFSDGSINNFHQIQKFQLTNATSGSGIADYNAATVKVKITTKKIEIGDWDMVTFPIVKSVPHNLGTEYSKKIIRTSGYIIRDDSLAIFPLYGRDASANTALKTNSDSSNIYIFSDSTDFATTDFDATSFNRGYIFVTYGDI
jgi:hypothetical protein